MSRTSHQIPPLTIPVMPPPLLSFLFRAGITSGDRHQAWMTNVIHPSQFELIQFELIQEVVCARPRL
jgi:hypothetical protein